ncbi:MAG: bifunctional hydroxymethylpyrimidine kinase/phosphomethylpyrimidine kinase [Planctomycetota bacterium]
MPRVLVVAGHDPTGGAGVDADREAIEALGASAACVITARTDQARVGADRTRVRSLGARDPGAWLAEARAELADPPAAVKLGMLPGAAHVRAAARLLGELPPALPRVLDPVLAASGGEVFLDADGIEALLAELLPLAPAVTPNVPEAARLTGLDAAELARDPDARVEAARRLQAAGAGLVVLKGGHGDEDPVRELVLAPGAPPAWAEHPRVRGKGLHGSGCRFASALAAGLAQGLDAVAASARAGELVANRIQELGSGLGAGPSTR